MPHRSPLPTSPKRGGVIKGILGKYAERGTKYELGFSGFIGFANPEKPKKPINPIYVILHIALR